jgi:hypothetical protein
LNLNHIPQGVLRVEVGVRVVRVVFHNLKILKMPLTNVSCVLMFPHRLQRWRRGTQPHNWPCPALQILSVHAGR